MSDQNKCYGCKFRGELAGNTHSQCLHPVALAIKEAAPLAAMLSYYGGGPSLIPSVDGVPLVKGNEHGIRHGWFCWPFNFDPTWLEDCKLFEVREAERRGFLEEASTT